MADSRLRVFDYVDQLNVILDRATKVPLSTRVVVDKQEVKQILQRVESSIDPDIRTAKDIIQQYDELIQKANRQAEQVTSEANEAARRAVDDANARRPAPRISPATPRTKPTPWLRTPKPAQPR